MNTQRIKKIWGGLSVIAMLFFTYCPGNPSIKDKDLGVALWVCTMITFNNYNFHGTVEYTDMFDGTIRKAYVRQFTNCQLNTYPKLEDIVYIKKCLQGQVYVSNPLDPLYNTCQGDPAGNSSNNWNASTFQFCTAPDTSCETPGTTRADPVLSPAAAVILRIQLLAVHIILMCQIIQLHSHII